jgi:hypothetical protein
VDAGAGEFGDVPGTFDPVIDAAHAPGRSTAVQAAPGLAPDTGGLLAGHTPTLPDVAPPLTLQPHGGALVFVELLHRDGSVTVRTRVRRTPFDIGRAYDNDLIVDDPHVAPHHLRIVQEPDGTLSAHDLTTVNGLVQVKGARTRRLKRLRLDDDTVARIGQTQLRVRSSAFRVAPEQPLGTGHWHERPGVAPLLLTMVVLYGLLQAWIGAGAPRDGDALVSLPLLLLGAVALWGGAWGLVSRLFAHRAMFGTHLALGAAALLAIEGLRTVLDTAAFAFGSTFIAGYSFVLYFGAIGVAVYLHMRVIQPQHRRRSFAIAALVGALAVGIPGVRHFQQSGSPAQATFLSDLSWPRLRLRAAIGEDAFFDQAAALKPQVDGAVGDVGADSGSAED